MPSVQLPKKEALIVDDDARARELLSEFCRGQGFEVATFTDPFGNTYVDSLPVTTRPNFALAATSAGVLWAGAAYEAMSYARRTRARAESIIQISVPGTTGDAEAFLAVNRRSLGAGIKIKLP